MDAIGCFYRTSLLIAKIVCPNVLLVRLCNQLLLTFSRVSWYCPVQLSPRFGLAIAVRDTAARSRTNLQVVSLASFKSPSCAACCGVYCIRRHRREKVSLPMEETDYRVKIWKYMNQYDKLEHETRAWSVCEAAQFLGYN